MKCSSNRLFQASLDHHNGVDFGGVSTLPVPAWVSPILSSPDPRTSLPSRESGSHNIPRYPTISRFKTFDRRQPEALAHNAPSAAIQYEHPWRAALTVSLYRSVDSLGVVGRVCRDPCQRALDLLEQRGYTSRIASLAASQITGGDITSIRIDDKVELAPSAVLGRLAHVPAMNLDAGTVHEDVNRLVMAGPVERDLAESLGTSREGCLVRNL